MKKLGVAILDDSLELLRMLRDQLKETGMVEVLVTATESSDFIQKVRLTNNIDLLVLDIELLGDSMSGLDVAKILKMPVLFISGKTRENLTSIEYLPLDDDIVVEHLTKPVPTEKLNKMLPKIAERILQSRMASQVTLKLERGSSLTVPTDAIVYVSSAPGLAGRSNNKLVHFIDRKPVQLIDISFKDIESLGLVKHQFIVIGQSYRVNVKWSLGYDHSEHTVAVRAMNENGVVEEVSLKVSDNYRVEVRKRLR